MFICDKRSVVVLEWTDPYGNQCFRYGSNDKDVIWLTHEDKIKGLRIGVKGKLYKLNNKWYFEAFPVKPVLPKKRRVFLS